MIDVGTGKGRVPPRRSGSSSLGSHLPLRNDSVLLRDPGQHLRARLVSQLQVLHPVAVHSRFSSLKVSRVFYCLETLKVFDIETVTTFDDRS